MSRHFVSILLLSIFFQYGSCESYNLVNIDTNNVEEPITTTTEYFLDRVKNGIVRELFTLKRPFNQIVMGTVSWKCSVLKDFIGLEYSQIKGKTEPDVNKMTLELRNRSIRVLYNITDAARMIPLTISRTSQLTIIINGFWQDSEQINTVSEAVMSKGDMNVLLLDTTPLMSWSYFRSSTYVRFFGTKLGETLAAMINYGINPENIHMIGHGLGAHIAGFAGAKTFELSSRRIGRISGLDPAGPCYSHEDPELRLKASDAYFVDVIHTDDVLGLFDPVGHIDFYPNGGARQPNCGSEMCSHNHAWTYFVETIQNPSAFPAIKCTDWNQFRIGQCDRDNIVHMGYNCPCPAQGLYYLQTGLHSPYGIGENGLIYKNNEGLIKTVFTSISDGYTSITNKLRFWN